MYLKSELCFVNNGKKIFGELYLPSIHDDKKIPIVIISHGFYATEVVIAMKEVLKFLKN